MNIDKQQQSPIEDDDTDLGNSLPYLGEATEVKIKVKHGRDSSGNMWLIEGENACWEWGKYRVRGGEKELLDESNEAFKTMEDCEADAKDKGMDGKFL